jgi:hypothetical protein
LKGSVELHRSHHSYGEVIEPPNIFAYEWNSQALNPNLVTCRWKIFSGGIHLSINADKTRKIGLTINRSGGQKAIYIYRTLLTISELERAYQKIALAFTRRETYL